MKGKEKQYQKMVRLLLDNGYSDVDIKRSIKKEYHEGIEESWREWMGEKHKKHEQEWFKNAWDYGWPVIPTYDRLHKYILKEAKYHEAVKKVDEIVGPVLKKHPSGPSLYTIELSVGRVIGIALALGYAIGQMGEATDIEPFEYLKTVIREKKLLPYLPKERKADKAA